MGNEDRTPPSTYSTVPVCEKGGGPLDKYCDRKELMGNQRAEGERGRES